MSKINMFACASMLAMALGAPAAARAADAPDDSAIAEIVVTARRVSENLQDIPVAVTALTGEMIEDRSISSFSDMGKVVPNLFVRPGPQDPSTAFIYIRGQSQPDSLITIDPAVGLYVDGVNYPRAFGMNANVVDVERVEVLRGPQGTLYGKNTTGGAFSVITRSPTDEFGASLKLRAGNYASYGGQGVLNLPFGDKAGLRLVAAFSERDKGLGKNALGHELGTEESRFFRGKFLVKPSDTLSIQVSADYQRYRNGGPSINLGGIVTPGLGAISYGLENRLLTLAEAGLIPGTPANGARLAAAAAAFQAAASDSSFYSSNGTWDAGSAFNAYGYSLDLNWEVSDHAAIRSISSWRWYKRDTQYDLDVSPGTIVNSHTITPKDRNMTQELQLLGTYDDLNYVIGLYGSDELGRDGSDTFNLGGLANFARSIQDATIKSRSLGAFAQASWTFVPDWTLTGGFRYTSERKIMINRNRAISRAGVVTCNVPVALRDDGVSCEGTLDVTFTKPTWLVSLDHKFGSNHLVYAKVSRGFRGGGHNLRGSGSVASFQPFAPETVTEYEAGFKSELLDRRLILNAAAFYADLKNVQRSILVSVGGTATATVVTNAAAARLYGAELEATFRPTRNLTLSGAVSHTNAKYKRFVDFSGDRSNEMFGNPSWQFNASAAYTVPTSFGDLTAQLDYYRQSRLNLVPAAKRVSEVLQPAYGLLNGRVSLAFEEKNLEVALFARNITKKKYSATGIGLEALGYNVTFAGEPRIVGVELNVKFGGEAAR